MTIVRLPRPEAEIWDRLRIDRRSAIPIYVQLKAQLEYAIATGRVVTGTRLLSVRALAERLSVASLTVRQAYDELERQGLVVTRQGAGSYASAPPASGTAAAWDPSVLSGVDHLLEEAASRGVPISAVVRAMRHRFALVERGPVVGFVGVRSSAERYASELGHALPGVARPVHALAIEDVRAAESLDDVLGAITHVVSLTFHHREIETLLGSRPVRALPIVAELSANVVRAIGKLPKSAVPLLICREASRPIYEELVQSQRPAGAPLLFARDDHPAEIARALPKATIVLHTTVAAAAAGRGAPRIRRLELQHSSTQESLGRVVDTIRSDWEQAVRLQHSTALPTA